MDLRHSARMRWAFERVSIDTPQAALDVATYLSQLPGLTFADSDPRHGAEGRSSFNALCAACHGQDAKGGADGNTPSLRAQHDSYLVSRLRQFDSASPTVQVNAHVLDDHTITAISAYLSSLRGPAVN